MRAGEWWKNFHPANSPEFPEIKNNIGQPNFETLVLALCCYCGDNVKYGVLSKILFQRKQQHGGWENLRVTINFYKKTMTFSHHME